MRVISETLFIYQVEERRNVRDCYSLCTVLIPPGGTAKAYSAQATQISSVLHCSCMLETGRMHRTTDKRSGESFPTPVSSRVFTRVY